MLPKLLTSIFGSRNDRLLKQNRRVVDKINAVPTVGASGDPPGEAVVINSVTIEES